MLVKGARRSTPGRGLSRVWTHQSHGGRQGPARGCARAGDLLRRAPGLFGGRAGSRHVNVGSAAPRCSRARKIASSTSSSRRSSSSTRTRRITSRGSFSRSRRIAMSSPTTGERACNPWTILGLPATPPSEIVTSNVHHGRSLALRVDRPLRGSVTVFSSTRGRDSGCRRTNSGSSRLLPIQPGNLVGRLLALPGVERDVHRPMY